MFEMECMNSVGCCGVVVCGGMSVPCMSGVVA